MPNGELSEAQRIFILAQAEGGCGTAEIADALGCSRRAIQKVIHRWKTDSTTTRRDRMGRPPKLTSRDHRRLLRIVKREPKIEYSALVREAGFWDTQHDQPTISQSTIQRVLDEEGYHKFRSKRRPFISSPVAKIRHEFAQRWCNFSWDGDTVVKFSDECSIARGSGRNTQWVWRLPAQKWSKEMIEPVSTRRQPARMVWGAIWMSAGGQIGRSPLVIMTRDASANRRGYTARSYIQALEEGLLDNYSPGEWFMQDNAPIHTATHSRDWLEDHGVATMDWPPYSPDLKPIEHLWWALKKKLHDLHPEFDTIGDSAEEWEAFENGLVEAWFAIPDTLIASLILSMPQRIRAVIQAKGYQTKY